MMLSLFVIVIIASLSVSLLYFYVIRSVSSSSFPINNASLMTIGSIDLPYQEPIFYPSFLSTEQCQQIIQFAQQKGLKASETIGYQLDESIRKSQTCWLSPKQYPLVSSLYDCIRQSPFLYELIKPSLSSIYMEELQVVCYGVNGYYKKHYDQCETCDASCYQDFIRFKGPRYITILFYLNDGEEYGEGETEFENMKRNYKGKIGDMLLFFNLDASQRYIHPKSLHQGLPLTHGHKWIANLWIRIPSVLFHK